MQDCQFGVSPVNYSDSDQGEIRDTWKNPPEPRQAEHLKEFLSVVVDKVGGALILKNLQINGQ